tara:strand:+ start:517 stop:825 length:309 start_codon:yes stop_codon:yes gene_type:complete
MALTYNMETDDAIRAAYPSVCTIHSKNNVVKAYEDDGTEVSLNETTVNNKKTELQTAYDNDYKRKRVAEYPTTRDQLDLIYHSGVDAWKAKIKETKDKYPKP